MRPPNAVVIVWSAEKVTTPPVPIVILAVPPFSLMLLLFRVTDQVGSSSSWITHSSDALSASMV